MRLRYSVVLLLVGTSLFGWICWQRANRPFPKNWTPLRATLPKPFDPLLHFESNKVSFSSIVTSIRWTPEKQRYLFSTKDGSVWWVDKELKHKQLWFTVPDIVDGKTTDPGLEYGLLSVALPPDWQRSRLVYASYLRMKNLKLNQVLAQIIATDFPNLDVEFTQKLIERPIQDFYHFGGDIQFDSSGFLYYSLGDNSRASFGWAGDVKGLRGNMKWRGTVLRLNVDKKSRKAPPFYSIPTDNPYAQPPKTWDETRPEIWASGFRNPWKMLFDSHGRLFVADVGENTFEELNLVVPGAHYGWPWWEGTLCAREKLTCDRSAKDVKAPIVYYGRDAGSAIVGAAEYLSASPPSVTGKLILADHIPGHIWALDSRSRNAANWNLQYLARLEGGLTTIAASASGGLIVATMARGVFHSVQREAKPVNR
jgi:glucose/arabinose dehydrogenase